MKKEEKIIQGIWKQNQKELEEYLGKSIESIQEEYEQYMHDYKLRLKEFSDNLSSKEKVVKYYKDTKRYLYELMRWEAEELKQKELFKIFLFLKSKNINKVLDYGGGVGSACLYLRNRGISCDYADVSGETFNLARWRFRKRNINIRMYNVLGDKLNPEYSAVIVYDVLEHLWDIPRAIDSINSMMFPRGFLISKSTFTGGGVHLEKNEKYQDIKKFNKLLMEKCFKYIGRLKISRLNYIVNQLLGINKVFSIRISKKQKYGGNFIIYQKIN